MIATMLGKARSWPRLPTERIAAAILNLFEFYGIHTASKARLRDYAKYSSVTLSGEKRKREVMR